MPTYIRDPNRANRWQDWATLILAIWLFVSPWVLQFAYLARPQPSGVVSSTAVVAGIAAWNAWVLGVIIGLAALSAIGKLAHWQEWLTLLLSIWVFAAPWALGFIAAVPVAAWDHWVVGVLVFLLSLWNFWLLNSTPAARYDVAHAGDRPATDGPGHEASSPSPRRQS